jgi:hypothetical protein
MKVCISLLATRGVVLCGILCLSANPSRAEDSPNPDRLLQEMSAKLAKAQTLKIEAVREIDPILLEHPELPSKTRISIVARRPNMLVAQSTGDGDVRHVHADGRQLSFYDADRKTYASAPFRGSIDALIDELDHVYGFTPPLVEFARNDVYQDITKRTQHASYLGRGRCASGLLGLNGVECYRLALGGSGADVELWIGVSDLLPHRLIATLKAHPSRPQVKVNFVAWDLDAKVEAQEFVFKRPRGATRIPLRTRREVAAASRNVRTKERKKTTAAPHSQAGTPLKTAFIQHENS